MVNFGGNEKSILGGNEKVLLSVNFVHKFNNNNLQFSQSQKSGFGVSTTMEGR